MKKRNKFKKNNTMKFVYVLVAIVVIAAIVSAFYLYSPTEVVSEKKDYKTYNGFLFEQQGKYWITMVELQDQPYEAPFYNHPLDLANISYDDAITNFLLAEPHTDFVIAVRPDAGSVPVLAGVNVARVTGRFYGMPTSSALYGNESIDDMAFPTVTCADATSLKPIIWINTNTTEKGVFFDDSNEYCVQIAAPSSDEILAVADIFTYKILGIMK